MLPHSRTSSKPERGTDSKEKLRRDRSRRTPSFSGAFGPGEFDPRSAERLARAQGVRCKRLFGGYESDASCCRASSQKPRGFRMRTSACEAPSRRSRSPVTSTSTPAASVEANTHASSGSRTGMAAACAGRGTTVSSRTSSSIPSRACAGTLIRCSPHSAQLHEVDLAGDQFMLREDQTDHVGTQPARCERAHEHVRSGP